MSKEGEGEGGVAPNKGISITNAVFGPITYNYEYDGRKNDAPRMPPEQDEWVVRNYRNGTNRIAKRDASDVTCREDVHGQHYNTGTVYSHHSFSARKSIGEEPRWPCAELVRGNIHEVDDAGRGLLKTAPLANAWWSNSKTQPTKTPSEDKRSRGVHVSTFSGYTGPLLNADDLSGRRRVVLQDSERVDRRFEAQEGVKDILGYTYEVMVPRFVVPRVMWEDWDGASEKVTWRDGSTRWARGIRLEESESGEVCLLMRRRVFVKGIAAVREALIRVVHDAVGGDAANSMPIGVLRTAWEFARVQAGLKVGDWEAEIASVPLTATALFDQAAIKLPRPVLLVSSLASSDGARDPARTSPGGAGSGRLSKGASSGSKWGSELCFMPVAVFDEACVEALWALRRELEEGRVNTAQFEAGKSEEAASLMQRLGVAMQGVISLGDKGAGKCRLLSLSKGMYQLRIGRVHSSEAPGGGYRGFQVCDTPERAVERARRVPSRIKGWAASPAPRERPHPTNGAEAMDVASSGDDEARTREIAEDLLWAVAEARVWHGRKVEVAPGVVSGVGCLEVVRVFGMRMCNVGIAPWRTPHWDAGLSEGMKLSKEELAARGGLRGPARVGWGDRRI